MQATVATVLCSSHTDWLLAGFTIGKLYKIRLGQHKLSQKTVTKE